MPKSTLPRTHICVFFYMQAVWKGSGGLGVPEGLERPPNLPTGPSAQGQPGAVKVSSGKDPNGGIKSNETLIDHNNMVSHP